MAKKKRLYEALQQGVKAAKEKLDDTRDRHFSVYHGAVVTMEALAVNGKINGVPLKLKVGSTGSRWNLQDSTIGTLFKETKDSISEQVA